MSSEWKQCTLSQIGKIITGKTPSTNDKSNYCGDIPFLTPSDDLSGKYVVDTQRKLSAKGVEKVKNCVLPKNAVCVSCIGSDLGKIVITTSSTVTNQQFNSIIVDTESFDVDFVYYALVLLGQKLNYLSKTSTAVPIVNKTMFSQQIISCPDLKMQRVFGRILSTLDNKIQANKLLNDNLETQAKLLFDEWFVKDGGSKTAGAKDEVLGNVISVVKKTFNPEKEPETGLEHYSIPAFDAGKFPVFESSLSIKSNKYIVDKDCFMISKLNPTTKRVWRPYCLTSNAVCSTEFIVFKAKESAYTDFLYSLINCDVFSEHLCNHVTGSTGSRQRTNPDDALKFMFKLPTKATIADFSSIVAPMYDQIRTNAIENNSLRQLRDYLLPLLMSGQISIGG